MRRARKATLFWLGITAALALAGAIASPALASKKDDTIRFASQQTLPSLDKYFSGGSTAQAISHAVWDTLIYRDPDTGEFKGELATAWRWLDDKTLELDLRQGVRFQNGAAFDADDVVYTLRFAANPDNKNVAARLVRWIDRVEKIGPYRVRIVTKAISPTALAYLASPALPIYPHAYYAAVGPKGMGEKPVGTGPYRVTEYGLGKFVRLERNPDYFKDSPKRQPRIGKIDIRFIPDPQTRVAEIVSGGLDLVLTESRDQAEQLRTVPSLQIQSGETADVTQLRMNSLPQTSAPPLRDVRVRQAIAYAIDREAMVKYLVGSGARVLHAACHPIEFGCDDSAVPRYPYDPVKAKQLLAQAGFAGGFDLDIYAYRDRNQTEAIIGYLNAVGIRARLRFLETGPLVAARRSGKAALAQGQWTSQTADLSDSASVYHEFSAADENRDPELRDLLRRGDSSMNPEIRKDAYAKALKLIAERAYEVPLYSQAIYYLTNKDLAFKTHLDGVPRFYEMSWK